jgi:Zn-dependent peptidase ImmA (M78 family)/transcriptional regulator with XRE-family HTH domain
MIFGERVEQAREFRGLTQTELAEAVGLKQVSVARVERGSVQPGDDVVSRIAEYLRFPSIFFAKEPLTHIALGTLEFRARADTTAKAKKRAYRYANIVFELAASLAKQLNMPAIRLPRLEGDPEAAALLLRSEIGLPPNAPIPNLVDALERAGVFVFALPDLFAGCDGFSAWATLDRKLVPAIFVSAGVPGDRGRLTTAHEVGELTLLDLPPGRERERSANRFAGALLMPKEAFVRDLVPPVTLNDFIPIKQRYGVSIQAALVRAYQLGIVTERRYNTLYKEISIAKWRKKEPIYIPPEKPRALSKMAEVLYGENIDIVRVANDAGLEPLFVKQLLAAHATRADLQAAPPAQSAQILSFNEHVVRPRKGRDFQADQA